MNPDKLTITNWETFEDIEVLFNPERYTLNKGVHIAEITIPGLDSPVLQFVRGLNEKITMELFFDTTKHGMLDPVKDVRRETRKIYELLKINQRTHARSEEHTSELQSPCNLVCRLLLEKQNDP